MRLLKLILLLALLSPALAQAQIANDTISILDQLKTLPLKDGVMYDFKNHRVLNTLALGVLGYGPVSLDLSYIGIDGLGVTLDYNLSDLPVKNVPILNYVQYLNIGYTVGYRTLTNDSISDNPKSDNQFIQGPTVFIKFKF